MSFPVIRTLSALAVAGLVVSASVPALADGAQISAKIAELKVTPDDNAKTIIRLGKGREVAVLAKSDDGNWVHISGKLERAEDMIAFEGWVDAADLRSSSGRSMTSATPSKSKKSTATAKASSDDGFGSDDAADEPAKPVKTAAKSSDAGWAPTDEPAAATSADGPKGDNSWDTSASASPDAKASPKADTAAKSDDDGW
jgi:hypothetical protein